MILPLAGAFFNAYAMHMLHELRGKVPNNMALQYFYIAQILLTGMLQNFQEI